MWNTIRALGRRHWSSLVVATTLYTGAAMAATTVVAKADPPLASGSDQVVRYLFLTALIAVGWAANSLPVLADWADANGKKRLIIVQGMVKAGLAGFSAYFTAIGAGQNTILAFLAAATAAYTFDRYFKLGKSDEAPAKDAGKKPPTDGEPTT